MNNSRRHVDVVVRQELRNGLLFHYVSDVLPKEIYFCLQQCFFQSATYIVAIFIFLVVCSTQKNFKTAPKMILRPSMLNLYSDVTSTATFVAINSFVVASHSTVTKDPLKDQTEIVNVH